MLKINKYRWSQSMVYRRFRTCLLQLNVCREEVTHRCVRGLDRRNGRSKIAIFVVKAVECIRCTFSCVWRRKMGNLQASKRRMKAKRATLIKTKVDVVVITMCRGKNAKQSWRLDAWVREKHEKKTTHVYTKIYRANGYIAVSDENLH